MKKIIITCLIVLSFSISLLPQEIGFGLHTRLFPSVDETILHENSFYNYNIKSIFSAGLFVTYRSLGSFPVKLSLKYSYSQKDVTEPIQGASLYEPDKYLHMSSFELAVCYEASLLEKLKLNFGIMPGHYTLMLNESYTGELNFFEHQFSLTPIVEAAYNIYDKIDINILFAYTIAKYRIAKEAGTISGGYLLQNNEYEEYDFSGLNLGLSVTYWIDL